MSRLPRTLPYVLTKNLRVQNNLNKLTLFFSYTRVDGEIEIGEHS